MEEITLIIAFIIMLTTYFLNRKNRIAKYVNKLPGPLRLPFIGTVWTTLLIPRDDFYRTVKKRFERHGKIIRTWLGNNPYVHVVSPKAAELILNNSVQITKSSMYDALHPWLGQGLLTSAGETWFRHRKLITPTFHFKILDSFMNVFAEKSKILIKQLEDKANGEIFDIYPDITNCTLDIICETAMGVKVNAMLDKNNEYVKAVHAITQLTLTRVIKPWLHSDVVYFHTCSGKKFKKELSTLHSFTTKLIEERRALFCRSTKSTKLYDVGTKRRTAFLDLLIEASENGTVLTDTDIREEVDTFMFEGHDTTAAAVSWTLLLLGNHPEIQEEVYREISDVLREETILTVHDLGEFKLLERCIKEALRLYPSVPSIGRRLSQDVTIDNYLLPAGCSVLVHIFLLHRDEEYFKNPEQFDPDRFLPENLKGRHAYSYIPFSAGSRNCIGQRFAMYEEKTILAYILNKFKVKAIGNQKTVSPVVGLILRPKDGLKIVLEARN